MITAMIGTLNLGIELFSERLSQFELCQTRTLVPETTNLRSAYAAEAHACTPITKGLSTAVVTRSF